MTYKFRRESESGLILVNIEIDTTPGNVLSDKGSFRIDSISCG